MTAIVSTSVKVFTWNNLKFTVTPNQIAQLHLFILSDQINTDYLKYWTKKTTKACKILKKMNLINH